MSEEDGKFKSLNDGESWFDLYYMCHGHYPKHYHEKIKNKKSD